MPDTTNLDMTLTEAEKLLGVKDGYAHGDVQQAYRSIARKYHPDKWLDKPEDERKRATRIYERANVARRVLLNPSLAKPEDGRASRARRRADAQTLGRRPRMTTARHGMATVRTPARTAAWERAREPRTATAARGTEAHAGGCRHPRTGVSMA